LACHGGPKASPDGLVLSLDAVNLKGYDNSENLITNSEFGYLQLSGNTTATGSQLFVPYGRLTAVNFVNNGGSGDTYIYQSFNTSFATGTQCVVSVFSNTSTLNLGQGGISAGNFTLLNSGSISLGNNWWRHWRLYSANVSNPSITPQVAINPGNNITLSGWQVEKSPTVGPYYATAGTIKNRGTTWTDLSGRGNNGTLTNGPTYSSSNGGSIVFDGTNDYINIPNATNLNNLGSQNFTVSMWVYRVTNPPAGNGEMLYQSSNTDNGFLICISGANFRIELRDNQSTNSSVVGVSDVFTAGTWNNVVLSKQGTTYTGYSQGISKGSFTSYQDVSTSTGYVNIGMTDWWGDSFWEGNISQVQVYNRALTASEIQQNYTATKSRYGL